MMKLVQSLTLSSYFGFSSNDFAFLFGPCKANCTFSHFQPFIPISDQILVRVPSNLGGWTVTTTDQISSRNRRI
jgi:hypothetical protein